MAEQFKIVHGADGHRYVINSDYVVGLKTQPGAGGLMYVRGMASESERLQITLAQDEFAAAEDWLLKLSHD